jgi:hypothetical protein
LLRKIKMRNGLLRRANTLDTNPNNNVDAGLDSAVAARIGVKHEAELVVHIEGGVEIGERRTVRGEGRTVVERGDEGGERVILPPLLFEDQSATWHLCVVYFWKILSWLKVSL